ncbi:MAG: hypothetical protein CMI55_00770 [Parcubacteria group bacterium]|jgi:RND family efflux transporter MFP subunit|nr:hypothetical protein [Parcubacteria group bacterium]|tara:strand:- start:12505 stop:14115 length:1611 start_codon:yes stop_codon:yes gene_type:complete
MKKIIWITSLIAIIVGGIFIVRAVRNKESSYTVVAVARGEVVQNVSVTGTVVSANQIDLEFESSGRIRTIEVAVGDQAVAGQTLIRLNAGELNAQLQANRAALEVAQVKLAQTLAGTRPEDIQIYQAAVSKAEVAVANKEQALIDVQDDAANDLDEAYEDALDTVKTAYTTGDQALLITSVNVRQSYFNSGSQIAIMVKEKEDVGKKDLSVAQDYLDLAEIGFDYDKIESALDKIEIAISSIRDSLAYLRSALDDSTVSAGVAAADKTSIDTARADIDSELVDLTAAEQGINSTKITNQTDLNTAQANLETARADLKKVQDELISQQAGPRQTDIDLAQAEVKQAQAKVLQIQAQISKGILRAPVSGIITAVEKEVGETAQANSVVVSMISLGRFQIEANVSETEIAKVALTDKVEMTLDALGPDEKFTGQIIKIDPAETVVSGVIYYQITSVFDAEDERIKSGMTVNLDIETDKKQDVLYLPYYVIKAKNGNQYIQVLENGQVKEKIIKTGLEGETSVEIIEGLSEGEQAVVLDD